jgi:tryptophan 2,3-dioxygenase
MDELKGPVLPGRGASDYERYLRTDELLSLQKPPEEQVHRDELLFQTVHQSSELWLKFATNEVHKAAELIDSDELARAQSLLRRAVLAMQYVTNHLEMLGHMDPWDYHHIRVALGHGSGFDSPGFRQVPKVTQQVAVAFDHALDRASASFDDVYRHRAEHELLHGVAEALTDWDERISVWRNRHYSTVVRALGDETVGIQGMPIQMLSKLMTQRQLPKLWAVRSRLVEEFDAEHQRGEE